MQKFITLGEGHGDLFELEFEGGPIRIYIVISTSFPY